jgi:hypothetical protein
LGQEALKAACAAHGQPVVLPQFLDAEQRDDVLELAIFGDLSHRAG